jgi:hypothetical protein
MDELTYQNWWKLHVRAAREQPLSVEEQLTYHAGLEQLEAEELRQFAERPVPDRSVAIEALELEGTQLRAQISHLLRMISALEQRPNTKT